MRAELTASHNGFQAHCDNRLVFDAGSPKGYVEEILYPIPLATPFRRDARASLKFSIERWVDAALTNLHGRHCHYRQQHQRQQTL
jgi:hypothetical protein